MYTQLEFLSFMSQTYAPKIIEGRKYRNNKKRCLKVKKPRKCFTIDTPWQIKIKDKCNGKYKWLYTMQLYSGSGNASNVFSIKTIVSDKT